MNEKQPSTSERVRNGIVVGLAAAAVGTVAIGGPVKNANPERAKDTGSTTTVFDEAKLAAATGAAEHGDFRDAQKLLRESLTDGIVSVTTNENGKLVAADNPYGRTAEKIGVLQAKAVIDAAKSGNLPAANTLLSTLDGNGIFVNDLNGDGILNGGDKNNNAWDEAAASVDDLAFTEVKKAVENGDLHRAIDSRALAGNQLYNLGDLNGDGEISGLAEENRAKQAENVMIDDLAGRQAIEAIEEGDYETAKSKREVITNNGDEIKDMNGDGITGTVREEVNDTVMSNARKALEKGDYHTAEQLADMATADVDKDGHVEGLEELEDLRSDVAAAQNKPQV